MRTSGSGGLLVCLVPADPPDYSSVLFQRACGGFGDGAAAAGAERCGAGRSAFASAEGAERGGVRIGLVRDGAAVQDFDALGGGMAAPAGRSDEVGASGSTRSSRKIADETAAADGEEDGTGVSMMLERTGRA